MQHEAQLKILFGFCIRSLYISVARLRMVGNYYIDLLWRLQPPLHSHSTIYTLLWSTGVFRSRRNITYNNNDLPHGTHITVEISSCDKRNALLLCVCAETYKECIRTTGIYMYNRPKIIESRKSLPVCVTLLKNFRLSIEIISQKG